MRVESIPMQGVADPVIRGALDVLQRNIQALAGNNGFATKDDLAALKRLIGATASQPSTRTVTVISPTQPAPEITDALPVVSGASDQIWTLSASPPGTSGAGLPSTLQIINQSPGLDSAVDGTTGSGGDPLNFAAINIVGSYVYPAADMNLGFGGFLNFITRNLAGTKIQGAFMNGGLIGTTPGEERGDLDFGIYGHPVGGADGSGGGNLPRIIALREDAGQLHLVVDADNEWNLGNFSERWAKGYFADTVQCAGIDLNFNDSAPWVARLANPSSQISAGPYLTLVGYMQFYWNNTPVQVPCYTA